MWLFFCITYRGFTPLVLLMKSLFSRQRAEALVEDPDLTGLGVPAMVLWLSVYWVVSSGL